MGLFKLENQQLTLSREEIRSVPEFRTVLERDRGDKSTPGGRSEGDNDGRKKFRAFKELMYIFYVADFESPFAKLDDKEKHEKACKNSNLEEGINFKVDKQIKAAILKYQELNYDKYPSYRILNTLETGINMSDRVLKTLIKSIENQLLLITNNIDRDPTAQVDVSTIVTNLNNFMSMSTSIPKALINIEEVRERVKQEQGSAVVLKGGREQGNREDPSYIKEKYNDTDQLNEFDFNDTVSDENDN